MKNLIKKAVTSISLACIAAVAMTSDVLAQTSHTAADPTDIYNAYRVDSAGGVLETSLGILGDGTGYLWLASIGFVVGWMLYRRIRRVAG